MAAKWTRGGGVSDTNTWFSVPGGDGGPQSWLRDADFRALFYNVPVAVLIGAPDGRILAANPAACRLLARTEAELCSVGRSALQDSEDLRWAVALAQRELTGQVTATLGIRRGDGAIIEADVESRLFSNEDGVERCLVMLREAGGCGQSP